MYSSGTNNNNNNDNSCKAFLLSTGSPRLMQLFCINDGSLVGDHITRPGEQQPGRRRLNADWQAFDAYGSRSELQPGRVIRTTETPVASTHGSAPREQSHRVGRAVRGMSCGRGLHASLRPVPRGLLAEKSTRRKRDRRADCGAPRHGCQCGAEVARHPRNTPRVGPALSLETVHACRVRH
eukprot:scaffold21458_cov167-Amphora_coffeaeformis.AAC.9